MMRDLVDQLCALGFSERVSSLYVTTMLHGESTVRTIAATLKYPRASVHDGLMTLVDHGFVRTSLRRGERIFVAESPLSIRRALEMRRVQDEERLAKFDALLPRLRALVNVGGPEPKVRYVEDIEGLRMFQRDFELLPGEILQLFHYETFCAVERREVTDEHREAIARLQKRVRSIVIADQPFPLPNDPIYDIRIIPSDIVTAPGEMSVCDDRVLLLSYSNGINAVEIRSQAIADVCRATLELAWRMAGEIGKWMGNETAHHNAIH
jgi:hypothetical protein